MFLQTILFLGLVSPIFTGDFPLIGVALLQSQPPYPTFGNVKITQEIDGGPLKIEGFVSNLLPNSQFGLHVHEQGDITSGCSSAGAHFNPYKKQHGSDRSIERHWGDLGNIRSNAFGQAEISLTIPQGSLIGTDGYIGRALVLHAWEDDFGLNDDELSKKTGNSGDRVACGVIGIRQPIDLLPIAKQQQQIATPSQTPTLTARRSRLSF